MRVDIHQHEATTSVELALGSYSVGGGEADGLRIPGTPAGLLELRVEPGRVVLVGRDTVSVDGVFVPPGLPRLLLPSEAVELNERTRLELPAPPVEGPIPSTVAVLRGLLAGGTVQSLGRAAFLVCLTGLDMGQRFPLSAAPAELGRGPTAAIRLRDRAVSRRHARLSRRGESFVVQDLGSPNGLYVNGRRVDGELRLEDGAILELGRTLLRYQAPKEVPAEAGPEDAPHELPRTDPSSGQADSVDMASASLTDPSVGLEEVPFTGAAELPLTRSERLPGRLGSRGVFEASLLAAGGVLAVAGCWVALRLA